MEEELDQASRKYVFSSYKVFYELQQAQNFKQNFKLKHFSDHFKNDIGCFLSDLYIIEQEIIDTEAKEELSRLCDDFMEFSRIFHLFEILCLDNNTVNEKYVDVVLWLQV